MKRKVIFLLVVACAFVGTAGVSGHADTGDAETIHYYPHFALGHMNSPGFGTAITDSTWYNDPDQWSNEVYDGTAVAGADYGTYPGYWPQPLPTNRLGARIILQSENSLSGPVTNCWDTGLHGNAPGKNQVVVTLHAAGFTCDNSNWLRFYVELAYLPANGGGWKYYSYASDDGWMPNPYGCVYFHNTQNWPC